MIVGGGANVGTTNLIIQPIKPSKRVVILGVLLCLVVVDRSGIRNILKVNNKCGA